MNTKRIASSSVLALAIVALAGCSTSALMVALNVVADAASVAAITAPILQASGGIAAPAAALIMEYSGSVSSVISKVEAELNSGDPNALKVSSIAADFAAVVIPQIPGAPANAVALINGVSGAVKLFIQQLEATLASAPKTARAVTWKPSMSDRRAIGRAAATAKKTVAAVAAYKAK